MYIPSLGRLFRQDHAVILAERVLTLLMVFAPVEVERESVDFGALLHTKSAVIWSQTSLTHVDNAPLSGGWSLAIFGSATVVMLKAVYFVRTPCFVFLLSMRSQGW